MTLKAIAVASGYTTSSVTSASYSFYAATPVVTPATGTYPGPLTVTMSSATTTATIYYTTAGNIPTTSSAHYTGPITVSSSETVHAIAAETGFTTSFLHHQRLYD